PIARIGKGVVDTTGAGDLFAAGFLVGQAKGRSLEESLRIGSIAAAEVISHFGARPETDLKGLGAAAWGASGVIASEAKMRGSPCPPDMAVECGALHTCTSSAASEVRWIAASLRSSQ